MGKLLFFSFLSLGHQNVNLMLGKRLFEKYGDQHEIFFLVDKIWKTRLEPLYPQFKYVVYQNQYPRIREFTEDIEKFFFTFFRSIKLEYDSAFDQIDLTTKSLGITIDVASFLNKEIDPILDQVKPDLIITDHLITLPCIVNKKIPYAILVSSNPLYFGIDQLPLGTSGLKIDDTEKNKEYRKLFFEKLEPYLKQLNNFYTKNNMPEIRHPYIVKESPHFNIYCYPKEIDYFEAKNIELPGRWFRLDSVVSPTDSTPKFEIPKELQDKPGKVIYLAFGSVCSTLFEIIQKLLDIFEHMPHKFIISKGPFGDSLKLPQNCWGEKFLNQKSVLQITDLMISHGGNNSLNECFHYGVPLIIMPFVNDQHDNGTRIEETGYGTKLNPFKCTKEEVTNAINSILGNQQIINKWKQASARIQQNNGVNDLIIEISKYIDK